MTNRTRVDDSRGGSGGSKTCVLRNEDIRQYALCQIRTLFGETAFKVCWD